MKKNSFFILRVALGITFLGIGIMVLQNPEAWASHLAPWATRLLGASLMQNMLITGILDIIVGILLMFNVLTWFAALVGAVHIAIVIVTCGFSDDTVRDIGLFGATLALALETLPQFITTKLKFLKM